ncbi:hypothetical protein GGS23DRAFT_568703 [Durotheca rogersii]|uniref:uncharacterized protein n=1 Tax=Durotheca rogersii TaxID=419775 RepID=UPI00221E6B76|nr:uncharacterized protein GGS23DRAFT_568703 [Durotheca rogersii]KAI5863202.1 hypothetical protein GGS23DRAFT_568703 [Durotheca rogersii]
MVWLSVCLWASPTRGGAGWVGWRKRRDEKGEAIVRSRSKAKVRLLAVMLISRALSRVSWPFLPKPEREIRYCIA